MCTDVYVGPYGNKHAQTNPLTTLLVYSTSVASIPSNTKRDGSMVERMGEAGIYHLIY